MSGDPTSPAGAGDLPPAGADRKSPAAEEMMPGTEAMPGAAPTLPTPGQAIFLYLIVMSLFVVVGIVLGHAPPVVRASVGSLLAILMPAVLFATLIGVDLRAAFRLTRPDPYRLGLSAAAAVSFWLLLVEGIYLQSLWFPAPPDSEWSGQQILRRELEMLVGQPWGQAIVVLAFLPATCEEFLFRGYLLTGFERGLGRRTSIVTCAFLFGLMHVIPIRVAATTLLGILFGFLCVSGGGLSCAIVAHGVNNLLSVVCAKVPALRAVPWLHGEAHVPAFPLGCAAAVFLAALYLLVVPAAPRAKA